MIDSVFPLALIGFLVTSADQTHVHNKTPINSALKTDKNTGEQTINCALKCRSIRESARLTLLTNIQYNKSTRI